MYYFASIDAETVGVISAILFGLVAGGSVIVVRIFNLGKVAQRLTSVESGLTGVQTDIKSARDEVKDARKDLGTRIDDLMKMLAEKGLSTANSPRVLSEEGSKVLVSSGIDTIVNDKYDLIVKKVKENKPSNSYQAEQSVLKVVEDLSQDPTLKDAIEEGAFNSGYGVSAVLFVGGLYIRDRVLKELGFSVGEIDKQKPKKRTRQLVYNKVMSKKLFDRLIKRASDASSKRIGQTATSRKL